MFNPEFLTTENSDGHPGNSLIQYLQEQSPDTLQRVAKSASNDIQDIIRHNVQGLLGMLPGEHFEVKVTANRDNLANICLLYTSPSPRDGLLSRMPSSA